MAEIALAALVSADPLRAYPALKWFETALPWDTEDAFRAWVKPLLGFVGLGYQFQLLRKLLVVHSEDATTGESLDTSTESVRSWLVSVIEDETAQLVILCKAAPFHAANSPSVVFELVAFIRAAMPLLDTSIAKLTMALLPILAAKKLPQYLYVECLAALNDTVDHTDDDDAVSFVDEVLAYVVRHMPTFISDVLATTTSIGASYFVGDSATPALLQFLLLALRTLLLTPQLPSFTSLSPATQTLLTTLDASTATPGFATLVPVLRQRLAELVAEEDDVLVSTVHLALKVHGAVSYAALVPEATPPAWLHLFSPPLLFAMFIEAISDDHSVLIDLITSDGSVSQDH
ncbi:hypothetical protein ACHHYP_12485 [Achlya hypogyna]|uniref:Uncharacterized protein n=1 Tax=Achlya hypogyna TaxID=1202772 RepID=A0A1V9YGW6_ACHHY|nr:hypothetical protein ACHHYP_12485 [Achlya hypogyna]